MHKVIDLVHMAAIGLQAGGFLMIPRPRKPTPGGPSPRSSRQGAILAGSGSRHRWDQSPPGGRGLVVATPDRRKRRSHRKRVDPPIVEPSHGRAATAPQRPSQNPRFQKHGWTLQGLPAQDSQREDRTPRPAPPPLRRAKRHRRNAHGYA